MSVEVASGHERDTHCREVAGRDHVETRGGFLARSNDRLTFRLKKDASSRLLDSNGGDSGQSLHTLKKLPEKLGLVGSR